MEALGEAIRSSSGRTMPVGGVLVLRPSPEPMLALLGGCDQVEQEWFAAQVENVAVSAKRLRYVTYAQAERDCVRLAAALLGRCGAHELKQWTFTAIPRGGLIVLGMLAYILGLERSQLQEPKSGGAPLVVVDDCCLTGARFGRFLKRREERRVIFAHLYSHPDLRAAIVEKEPKVADCIAAHDLHDYALEGVGDELHAWRERWSQRLEGPRYWIGQTEHVCFAWSEPARLVWNPVSQEVVRGWNLLPPSLCLGNRPAPGSKLIDVQIQPSGRGPLKPSHSAIFAEVEGQILAGNLETRDTLALQDVAADMWKAIVEWGNLDDVADALLEAYDVQEEVLRADLERFVQDLLDRGLLEASNLVTDNF